MMRAKTQRSKVREVEDIRASNNLNCQVRTNRSKSSCDLLAAWPSNGSAFAMRAGRTTPSTTSSTTCNNSNDNKHRCRPTWAQGPTTGHRLDQQTKKLCPSALE